MENGLFDTQRDRNSGGFRICANSKVNPAELAINSHYWVDKKWDEKKEGYPCFALRGNTGCIRVIMGCVRVVYGLSKTWFCKNMGCVREEYGILCEEYGILWEEYGILWHFLLFRLVFSPKKSKLSCFVEPYRVYSRAEVIPQSNPIILVAFDIQWHCDFITPMGFKI